MGPASPLAPACGCPQLSLILPQVTKSVHYCDATKAFTTMEYRDVTALSGLPTSSVYPTKDSQGNPLTTEYGLCTYKDSQTINVQVRC